MCGHQSPVIALLLAKKTLTANQMTCFDLFPGALSAYDSPRDQGSYVYGNLQTLKHRTSLHLQQPAHSPPLTHPALSAMAPKAEKKPAKKVAKSTSSAAAKKRKLAKAETYKIYIYKVLKQVCCLAR